GVDIELRRSMWEFLRTINAEGTTIILTTHYLEEAESLCRNVAIIDQGEIVQNTSMKQLLKRLNKEVFICDVVDDLATAPVVDGFSTDLSDEHSFEVEVEKGQSLNQVFSAQDQAGDTVVSMRNKANRLEELFVSIVSSQTSGEKARAV